MYIYIFIPRATQYKWKFKNAILLSPEALYSVSYSGPVTSGKLHKRASASRLKCQGLGSCAC